MDIGKQVKFSYAVKNQYTCPMLPVCMCVCEPDSSFQSVGGRY